MAQFTMELWEALQISADPGFMEPDAAHAGISIGLDDYPIFDETHRRVLNEKILERFWNREIGQGSIPKFRMTVRRRLNEIMPFYNKMYLSELIAYDPLATVRLETIRNDIASQTSEVDSANQSTSNTKSRSKSQASDTPQNELPDNWEEDADFASSGAAGQSVTDGTAATTGRNTESGTTHATGNSTITGFQGSASDLLGRYRAQIVNVDLAVVDALQSAGLFFGVWDLGEESFTYPYPYRETIDVSYATFRPLGDGIPDMKRLYEGIVGD